MAAGALRPRRERTLGRVGLAWRALVPRWPSGLLLRALLPRWPFRGCASSSAPYGASSGLTPGHGLILCVACVWTGCGGLGARCCPSNLPGRSVVQGPTVTGGKRSGRGHSGPAVSAPSEGLGWLGVRSCHVGPLVCSCVRCCHVGPLVCSCVRCCHVGPLVCSCVRCCHVGPSEGAPPRARLAAPRVGLPPVTV